MFVKIKKFFFLILFFPPIKIFSTASDTAKEVHNKKIKNKILIFSSTGGGGHTAVSNALKNYLQDIYDVKTVNIFGEVVSSLDPLRYISFGKFSSEDFYNFCLQCKWTGIISQFCKIGGWAIRYRQATLENKISEFVKSQNPDLVISVVPMINAAILNSCQKLQKPFLVITNDLDTTNYINGLSGPTYKKFYYTLSFDDQDLWKKIEPANIPKSQIKVIGFPLRPEFFYEKRDKALIYKDFSIPKDKKVIMLLMGGAGSLATYRYVRTLARYSKPIHIIACLGRNENLRNALIKISLPKHITLSVVGFTNRIADLMSVSDLIITKPGPGSICESITLNLPIIIDYTSGPLWWEMANIDLVKKHQFGDVLTKYRDLHGLLDKYLENDDYIKKIKNKMISFKEKTSFEVNLKNLLKEIIV